MSFVVISVTIYDGIHRLTGPVSFRSVARIFSPLLARKSSGFARILPDFLPEYGYFENSRGAAAPPPPPPASYAYDGISDIMNSLLY